MSKPTRRWLKKAELYKHFANGTGDFSEKSAQEMFDYESTGKGDLGSKIFTSSILNGYAYGKWLLDITVSMWKQGIKDGTLTLMELYQDKNYPYWWLNEVFGV